jgi:Ca2+-binding RTX toxin-like protein
MTTFTVTSTTDVINAADDATVFTLREALAAAAANGAGLDDIVFAAGLDNQTITLTSGPLAITSGAVSIHADIEGDGELDITLSGNNSFGFFNITGAATNVAIDSLNMVNGYVNTEDFGVGGPGTSASAISNAGTLTLSNSQIADTTVIADAGYDAFASRNGESGGNAAIISSSGTLNIVDTIIRNSSITAGAGGYGANGAAFAGSYDGYHGGAGGHAAAIISSGILNLQNALLRDVSLAGGAGGAGGNGVSYYDPSLQATYNGRGGNGGRGGDADLILNSGTARGEFIQASGIFNNGNPGGAGSGINGSPGGSPGGIGTESPGIVNIGAGTSVGVDLHTGQQISLLTIGSDGLAGGSSNNVMWGMNGNDFLTGEGGDDDIAGGAGNDQLFGDDGDDVIEGGAGNDIMNGGTNTAAGDTVSFAGFIAAAGSTTGINVYLANAAAQNTHVGVDTITNFENATGSDYDDIIGESSFKNIIRAGLGNDIIGIFGSFANVAGEIFDGGDGTDSLVFADQGNLTHNLRDDTVTSIEILTLQDTNVGGQRTVQLNANQIGGTGIASNAQIQLDGYADNTEVIDVAMGTSNTLNLAAMTFLGNITNASFLITGDSDGETITGSSITDRINSGAGVDNLNGGGGDDTLEGGSGGDTLDGGTNAAGGDTLSYATSTSAVTVNIGTNSASLGDAAGDIISNFENLTGSGFQDTLSAGAGANTLRGGADNDVLNGGTGSDFVFGDAGQDTIVLNNGILGDFDNINGGSERDLLDMSGITNGAVWIDFGYNVISGPNTATGFNLSTAAGDGRVVQMDSMIGTSFSDTLRGDAGSNFIDGGAGDDTMLSYSPYDTLTPYSSLGDVILGGTGNDLLFSGTGNDYLDGGADNDTIEVGAGTDTVITGTGNDIVFFSPNCGTDTVTDFTGGPGVVDVLKLYGFGTAFDTAAEVKAAASQHGLDTWIVLPGTTIILQNFTATNLANDDFVFV